MEENNIVRIKIEDYQGYGLDDLYYGLISFISKYATANFDPMENLDISSDNLSTYAFAINNMKTSIKAMLDFFKETREVYIPALNKKISLDSMNMEEQLALEKRCQEYIITTLNQSLEERQLAINDEIHKNLN